MTRYSHEDLQRIGDPVEFLRKRPSTYAGDRPWGPRFAARLMHDLILLDALPSRVERIGAWWLVSSERDWLASEHGGISTKPFFHIVAFPPAGDNSHRSEVLLTAFANAVLTCGNDGLTWIRGDPEEYLPDGLRIAFSRIGHGRIVAFKVDE
jgi:hypothetical protein